MTETSQFSVEQASAAEIEERAADFLQRRRFWKWHEKDQLELDDWLTLSLAHRAAFWRLEAGLDRADRLTAFRHPIQQKGPASTNLALIKGAAAFIALVAIALGTALFIFRPHEKTYATAIGGHEIVTLGDGSKIELNTNTVIHADVDENHRTASIEKGEAYFQISHDESKPFVVTANGRSITVLGTKFSVRAEAGRTEVALFEGRVWLGAGHGPKSAQATLLTPGDVVVATASSTLVTRKSVRDLSKQLGWRRGVLVFSNTTLSDAASEFNRYNRRKIVIAGQEAGQLRVGGTFPSNDADDFTRLVQSVLKLHVDRHSNTTVISR
jgi:transmembrane sensor